MAEGPKRPKQRASWFEKARIRKAGRAKKSAAEAARRADIFVASGVIGGPMGPWIPESLFGAPRCDRKNGEQEGPSEP